MSLQSNGYIFKPDEQPFMPGSPAIPNHPPLRKLAYFIIGVFLACIGGLQNGFTLASIPLLRGDLQLSLEEGAWLQASYYMVYACMSMYHFKIRENFGVRTLMLSVLTLLMLGSGIEVVFHNYSSALISRALSGLSANGLLVAGIFYLMQALPPPSRAVGIVLSIAIVQFGVPLGRLIVPFVFRDGSMTDVYVLQFGLALLCICMVALLPLPPTVIKKTITWIDIVSFLSLLIGVGLGCAFWSVGPTVWWDTWWLGYLAFFSLLFGAICFVIEYNRKFPMLLLDWIGTKNVMIFVLAAASARLLTAEQNVGAYGFLSAMGMDIFQLVGFNAVITIASVLGLIAGVFATNPKDIRRPVIIAFLLIAVASFIDVGQSTESRPRQMYLTQAVIAFSALFFTIPMLMEGVIRALARGTHAIISFQATFGLSQILGALVGNALGATFIRFRTIRHMTDMLANSESTNPQVTQMISALAAGRIPETTDNAARLGQGGSDFSAMIQQHATVAAYNDMFFLMGILASIAFLLAFGGWLLRYFRKTNIIGDEIAAVMKGIEAQKAENVRRHREEHGPDSV